MDNLIQKFEIDLRVFLENTYSVSDQEDEIKKLDTIEKTAADFVDRYLLETDLIAGDVALSVQHVLDDFIKSKI